MTLRVLLSTVICLYVYKSTNSVNAESSRSFKASLPSPNGLFGVSSFAGAASKNGKTSSVSGVRFYPGHSKVKSNNPGYTMPVIEENDDAFSIESTHNYANTRNDPNLKWYSGVNYFQKPSNTWATMEKDGRFASGRVQIFPNSKGISASAVAGYGPQMKWTNGAEFFKNTPKPSTVALEKYGRFATGKVQIYPNFNGVSASAIDRYDPGFKWENDDDYFQNPSDFFNKNTDPWFPKNGFNNYPPRKFSVPNNNWFYNSFDPFWR